MQKKIFVMAALAVLCSALPAFSAGTCENWKGVWEFTYTDNTTVNICIDNTTINDNLTLCDNGTENCICYDNITSKNICIDNTTFEVGCKDNATDCVCNPNPFYMAPSVTADKYQVLITETQDNVTTGVKLNCMATGTRTTDDKPILIVQPTPATFNLPLYKPFNFDNGTWLIYESTFSADTASKPFSEILSDNYTGAAFTTAENFNMLGIASGKRTGDLCQLRIIPNTVRKLFTLFAPVYPFVIIADKENDFEMTRPVKIDWGTKNIITLAKLAITKKLVIGFAFARPFQLESDTLDVTVTNSDNGTCFGTIDIKAGK